MQVLDELKIALGRVEEEDPLVQQLWSQLKTPPVQGSEAAILETLRAASIVPDSVASLVLPEGVLDPIQQLSWALAIAQTQPHQASKMHTFFSSQCVLTVQENNSLSVAEQTYELTTGEEKLLQAVERVGQQGTQIPTSLLHSLLLHVRSTAQSSPELLPAALRLPSSSSHILLPLIGTHPAAEPEAGSMSADVVKATGLAGVMEDLGFVCTSSEQAFAGAKPSPIATPD